jgi:6-pyruvoyltetrahydropterin/6-carboxytetrahydropterin synthase
MIPENATFQIHVAKEQFKFNAAHFVAFDGFRERLHGHNYQVGVTLMGSSKIGSDGYLIDFGDVKVVVKDICKTLNEHFLCPMLSDVMEIEDDGQSIRLTCQDGAIFQFPRGDCALLPIVHATTEELAIYLFREIVQQLGAQRLLERGIHTLNINVAEAPGQDATFCLKIPADDDDRALDVRTYLTKGKVTVKPCLSAAKDCKCCSEKLSAQLENLAHAINTAEQPVSQPVTKADLAKMLENNF